MNTLVTGAATGIGLAIARELSAAGHSVLATALPGQDTSELQALSHVEIVETDLSNEKDIDHLLARAQGVGDLDALISNAGIAVPGPLECIPIDQIKQQYQINVFAPIRLAQGLLPALRQTRGRMIFIGAGQGRVSLPFGGPYGSSKAALAALTDSLRAEVHPAGVSVILIEPGAVKTGILDSTRDRWARMVSSLPPELCDRYRSPMERTFQASAEAFEKAMAPQQFARRVVQILGSTRPRPRYLIGREAQVLALVALLPSGLRAALLSRMGR